MNTFNKVSQWNERCGNNPQPAGTNQYWDSLTNQALLIKEELLELFEAIEQKNILEAIDAGLDLDVVVSGLNYLVGADYSTGIKLVTGNNDLKYTKSLKKAQNWLKFHGDNGGDAHLVETQVGSQTYYCIKNSNGKVVKYGNFPKVDLTPTAPDLAIEGVLLVRDTGNMSEDLLEFCENNPVNIINLAQAEKDSVEEKILTEVLTEAGEDVAIVHIANGSFVGAEKFDLKALNPQDTEEG